MMWQRDGSVAEQQFTDGTGGGWKSNSLQLRQLEEWQAVAADVIPCSSSQLNRQCCVAQKESQKLASGVLKADK